jgi:hypothetical protein
VGGIFNASAATQTTAVTNSATLIFDADATGIGTNATIGDVVVINAGATTMFIGQSGVTSSTGLRVPPGGQWSSNAFGAIQSSTNYDIYAITASGTTTAIAGPATLDSNV